MDFLFSNNIGIQTKNPTENLKFYTEVLGFSLENKIAKGYQLSFPPYTFFLQKDSQINGPVFELMCNDIIIAKKVLLENNCEVVRWLGKMDDCYIKDPNGIIYNIWQSDI